MILRQLKHSELEDLLHTHTHTHTHAHARTRAHTHTHTRTRTRARAHTHTHFLSISPRWFVRTKYFPAFHL